MTTTLSALANIDSGTIRVRIDETIYPTAAVLALIDSSNPLVRAVAEQTEGSLWLTLEASDSSTARLQIGMALTQLLQFAVRERR